MSRVAPSTLAAALVLVAPGRPAAQIRPDDGVIATHRGAAAVALSPEKPSPRPPPPLAPDPFAWLRERDSPAAVEWCTREAQQRERWLAVDPDYAALLEEARRSAPIEKAAWLAAGRLFMPRAEDGGWRSRPLGDDETSRVVWRPEPAITAALDSSAGGATRLDCDPRGSKTCLLERSAPSGLTLAAYDPATARTAPSPFAAPLGLDAAALGDGGLLAASREAGVTVVRRLGPGQADPSAEPVLFRSAAGETIAPGTGVGAEGRPVAWLTVTDPKGAASLWIEAGGAFRRLAAPPGARIVGVVGGQLILLLRDGWAGVSDLPAGALIGLDLAPLLKRAPELTPRRILSLVDTPDVRAAQATEAGLLLVVHEGVSDNIYLCQPGLRGWAVRKLPQLSAEHWEVAAAEQSADAVLLRSRAFPGGERLVEVSTRTGLVLEPVGGRPTFAAAGEVRQAATLDQSQIDYTIFHGAASGRGRLPILLLAPPRDPREAAVLRTVGALWLARGGELAVAGRRARRYDAEDGYVDILTGYEDLSAIGRDLVAHGLAPAGRVDLAGVGAGASIEAVDLVKHPAEWAAVALIDPITDPLRAPLQTAAVGTDPFAAARRPDARALWRRVAAYDNLRSGVRYAPTLVVATREAPSAFASDGPRFTAKLNEAGGDGLYVEAGDGDEAAALTTAFLLRLSR